MEDSDVLPYLPTDKLPPVKKHQLSRKRRLFNFVTGLPVRTVNKTSSLLHVSRRLAAALLILALAVGGGTVYAALNIHATSSGSVGSVAATISGASVTIPSGSSGTPGTCTIVPDGQTATCSGTTLTAPGDTYNIALTVSTASAPTCTAAVASGTAFSVATPVVTGTTSPFTVTTTVTGVSAGTGSVSVSC